MVEPVFSPSPKRSERGKDQSEVQAGDGLETLSDMGSSPGKQKTVNRNGLVCLGNGVVSLRHLDLSHEIPSKTRSLESELLFGAKMSWGEAFSFFCLLKCGKNLPIEKHRDHPTRLQIMHSSFKYALDDVQRATLLAAEPAELNAYLLGMARATQQKLRYALYGMTSNHFNDQVFLRRGLRPIEEVQTHLGLVGPHEQKAFMDM